MAIFVIGIYLPNHHCGHIFILIKEHMEEDDQETKTIPEWVELEYRVGHRIFCLTVF